jgi:L-lactate utilization protein LutB
MDVEKLIKNLKARGFSVQRFATAAEMVSYLKDEINGCEVGIGGSQTVKETGLYDALKANNTVHWHWTDKDSDVLEKEIASEVFITGANAVSESGEIVNIDGRGNRLAAQVYGIGKRVYILAGRNKLCPDLSSAIDRAHNVAAVKNGNRFPTKTPCKIDGKCHDCLSPDRICRATLIIHKPLMDMKKMEVILVDEDLGF